jgi:lipopolysaccharide/colanic/teichoic acid biosynthesis glycosyltransferase
VQRVSPGRDGHTVIQPSAGKHRGGLSPINQFLKRAFDLVAAFLGLVLAGWIIGLAFIAASIDTQRNGFFRQVRVGRHGKLFKVIKIRTMRDDPAITTVVSTAKDPRITPLGQFFRTTKIDELPQLINVLLGQMSFVGPRPDVPGFADRLEGEDRLVLSVRPGITGPATLRFRHEEEELAKHQEPEQYNREVIFPEKVRLNRAYVENYRFVADLKYLFWTIFTT